jgi:replicative DNA helicase
MKQATLYSLQTERYALASLAKNNDLFPEIDSFCQEDIFYNSTHQIIFRAIKQGILNKEKYNNVLLTAKIQSLGITRFEDDLDIGDYIDSIFNTPIKKEEGLGYFKALVGFRIRRNIHELGVKIAEQAKNPAFENPSDLVLNTDKLYSEAIKSAIEVNGSKTVNIFEGLENKVEDLGNNPPDPNKYPMGPFTSINNMLGSLHRPGNITLYAARSKMGKSQLLLFINIWMAEKYGWPVYFQDAGEMTVEEMQMRAVSCLSGGEVPLHAVEQGTWRNNANWTRIIRELWPRIKKIKFYHEDISNKSPLEIISSVRRFSYNIAGRNNNFIWCLDYLKPFSDTGGESEWRQFGTFCQNIKSFIINELPINLQTAIQNNRKGINSNRNTIELDSEDAISQDRVSHQVSFGLILRKKTQDEIAEEGGFEFGNMKLSWPLTRHLGKDVERAENYVKDLNGNYRPNFLNLSRKNFYFQDMGDARTMFNKLQEMHNLQDKDGDKSGDLI